MGTLKRFLSGAQLHIGKTNSGRYKLYLLGVIVPDGPMHWIEAGGGAWRKDSPERFEHQALGGYDHPREVRDWAGRVFGDESTFDRFCTYLMGSESTDLLKKTPPPTFDALAVEPWRF